jgi:hypothetical protein
MIPVCCEKGKKIVGSKHKRKREEKVVKLGRGSVFLMNGRGDNNPFALKIEIPKEAIKDVTKK